jgi:hypothetical protein
VCTQDSRNGFICEGTPTVGAACNDQSVCTYHDVCVSGGRFGAFCQGTSVNCNDNNPCTNEYCDPSLGGCRVSRTFCNDGNTHERLLRCRAPVRPAELGSACDDSMAVPRRMSSGRSCAGTPLDATTGIPKPTTCAGSGCVHTPVNCYDLSATADGCNPANVS